VNTRRGMNSLERFWSGQSRGGSLPHWHSASSNMRVLKQNDLVGLFRKNVPENTLNLPSMLA
jgi:hypothetical protein